MSAYLHCMSHSPPIGLSIRTPRRSITRRAHSHQRRLSRPDQNVEFRPRHRRRRALIRRWCADAPRRQPEAVTSAVLWLLSEQASCVIGAALSVDGGMSAE